VSRERIRPGSARARQGDQAAKAGGQPEGEPELLEVETPVAVPLAPADGPGALDPMITGEETEQFVGPQPDEPPLRPEEFVSLEAAEEVLGREVVQAYLAGDEPPEDFDEVDEVLLEEELAPAEATRSGHREGLFSRLYHGRTRFDFVRRRRWWFAISGIVILAGAISLGTRGLNLGIDFAGGTSWTVRTATVGVNQARAALGPLGLRGSTITTLGSNASTKTLQVEAKLNPGGKEQTLSQIDAVSAVLARLAHVNPSQVSVSQVGPSWGSSVTHKAIEALIVFFILISLYISIFFEWRMALAAVIAVAHDVLVVVGIYSLTGFQVTPDTVVAILTILGYSLYDTIVVFDRVRDNVKSTVIGGSGRITITDIINLSMNQTLARSINTSLVAILPIFAVLILGADVLGATTLEYFGWALLIGLLSGAYSSLFIASPLVAVLKEREQRYRNIRARLAQRGTERLLLSAEAVAAGVFGPDGALATTRRDRRAERGGASRRGGSRPSGAPRDSGGAGRQSARITPASRRATGERNGEADAGEALPAEKVPAASSRNGSGRATPSGSVQRPPARRPRKGRRR